MKKEDEGKLNQKNSSEAEETGEYIEHNFYGELAGAVLFLLLGFYMIIISLQMPGEELTGNKDLWYSAPGIFPIFIGVVLMILSSLLLIQLLGKEGKAANRSLEHIKRYLKSKNFKLLILALIYLFIYIFILLGRIEFTIATFIFLCISMLTFNREKIAIWKLVLISLVVSVAIAYSFGTLAKIPLL